jgi:aspartate aminotransferase
MQFTQRISRISVSATMRVSMEAEKLRAAGVDVVDFGAGEPDFPTPDNVKRAAVEAMDRNFTKYTAAGGTMELRKALCERHRCDFGTSYEPSECIVTMGGKHAIYNAVSALIEEGDEVVLPVPYWVTFADVVRYNGGKCLFVQTEEANGFRLTAQQIEQAVTPRTRLVIINSPSNPSGAVLDRAEFEKIYAITSRRGITLMSDECYCHFIYAGRPYSIASVPGAKEHVVVVGSLSKTYAMTGWRVGFALAPAPLVSSMLKLQSHSTSNPNSIAQKAAVEALLGPQDSVGQMLAEYRRRREYVIRTLRAIPGIQCAEPDGAFYAYPNIGKFLGKDGMNTTLDFSEKLLADARVAVVPGEAFGTREHVRISYAASMGELERGLERLRQFVGKYS